MVDARRPPLHGCGKYRYSRHGQLTVGRQVTVYGRRGSSPDVGIRSASALLGRHHYKTSPVSQTPWARSDHWRGGRRSIRHLHVLGDRRGFRLRSTLDRSVLVSADGRRPDDVRAIRNGHRTRLGWSHPRTLSPVGAVVRLHSAGDGEHGQHRRGPWRHGESDGNGHRHQKPVLDTGLCGDDRVVSHLVVVCAPVTDLQVDDASAVCLCICGFSIDARLAGRAAVHSHSARGMVRPILGHAGGNLRNHHLPISLFLAGFSGSRRRARARRIDTRSPARRNQFGTQEIEGRRGDRYAVFERGHVLYHPDVGRDFACPWQVRDQHGARCGGGLASTGGRRRLLVIQPGVDRRGDARRARSGRIQRVCHLRGGRLARLAG